jgi:hypothetical protein
LKPAIRRFAHDTHPIDRSHIGGGGEGGNWHSRNEWNKPVNAWYGPQNALQTVLMLTGLDGATKPTLEVRTAAKQGLLLSPAASAMPPIGQIVGPMRPKP